MVPAMRVSMPPCAARPNASRFSICVALVMAVMECLSTVISRKKAVCANFFDTRLSIELPSAATSNFMVHPPVVDDQGTAGVFLTEGGAKIPLSGKVREYPESVMRNHTREGSH